MTDNKKQNPKYITHPITSAIDVLYTLLLFYEFKSWYDITNYTNKLLFLLLLILTIVDWLSSRATHDIYSIHMLVIDLLDVFFITNMANSLRDTSLQPGYNLNFWLYFLGISVLYAWWDFMLAKRNHNPKLKRRLMRWGYVMVFSAIICLLTFIANQLLIGKYINESWYNIASLLVISPAFFLWFAALSIWIYQRVR